MIVGTMSSVGEESATPAATLPAEHAAYITARFAATPMKSDPFPHLVIPDVLPADVYAAMEAASPSGAEWTLAGCVETFRVQRRTHAVRRSHFRAAVLAAGDCLAILGRNHGRFIQPMFGVRPKNPISFGLGRYFTFWRKYQPYFDLVDELALQAYRPYIECYMNSLRDVGIIRDMPSTHFAQSVFCQRLEGWLIGPHIHDLPQIIQSMIYFPLPNSHPEQGTILYKPRRPISIASSKLFAECDYTGRDEAESPQATICFEEHDVERVGIMSYVPNTLASFLNTPLSIHGTVAVPDAPARRYVFTATAFSRNAFSCETDHTIALAELSLR
jgi:hypothetical protein